MRLVEPASVVAHEVPHPRALGARRELQERERAVEYGCPLTVGGASCQLERDDRESRDVVDAVTRFPARDHTRRVLDDPDVINQGPQVIRSDRRELELDDRDRLPARSSESRLLQHDCGLDGDRRPGEPGTDPARLRAGRCQRIGAPDEVADRALDCGGVVERDELSRTRREHVLREEVRRGDRRAAGGDGEGQRARGDLLAVAVRRQEDVRGVQQVGQFGDGEKAIVELDVIGDSEVERATLEQESILLALQPRYIGVRPPRDEVQHLGMTRDDPR